MTTDRFRPYLAAYLILKHEGRILLSRRLNTNWHDGKFSLVSGHFEGNETAKEAIIRETYEEAGVQLDPKDLTVTFVLHRHGGDREYIDIFLTAENWTGQIENKEPEKCSELTWFSIDNLPDDLTQEIRFVLDQISIGEYYSEFGWGNKPT